MLESIQRQTFETEEEKTSLEKNEPKIGAGFWAELGSELKRPPDSHAPDPGTYGKKESFLIWAFPGLFLDFFIFSWLIVNFTIGKF